MMLSSQKKLFRNNPTYLHRQLCKILVFKSLQRFQISCKPTLILHSTYTRTDFFWEFWLI